MSSRKRSRNSNEDENKENDNRNSSFPKKPITNTLFEQRQAQSQTYLQNRAAGVADGGSENLGVQDILKKHVWVHHPPSFKPGIFAPAPSDAPGILAPAPSVAPGIVAPAPSVAPGKFSKAPGILASAPSVAPAPSVQLCMAGGRPENLRVYNPSDLLKKQVSSLKSGSGNAYAPPVSPVTPVAPAPPVSLHLDPQNQNISVVVAGGRSEKPNTSSYSIQEKPITPTTSFEYRLKTIENLFQNRSITTTSFQERPKTSKNSIQESLESTTSYQDRPRTTNNSIQEKPITTLNHAELYGQGPCGRDLQRSKSTTTFQERPNRSVGVASTRQLPTDYLQPSSNPMGVAMPLGDPLQQLTDLVGVAPPLRQRHQSQPLNKATPSRQRHPSQPVGVATPLGGGPPFFTSYAKKCLQHLTEFVGGSTPFRQRHKSQPVDKATPLRQRHPSQPVGVASQPMGVATSLRGSPQPLWCDDPTKQIPEGCFDHRDWECLYMPMEEVIGRMVYQGPKKRDFIDFKYSFGAHHTWTEAYLYSKNKGCNKPLSESKWYYCDCSVWCKCVECFCHKIWPDVEN